MRNFVERLLCLFVCETLEDTAKVLRKENGEGFDDKSRDAHIIAHLDPLFLLFVLLPIGGGIYYLLWNVFYFAGWINLLWGALAIAVGLLLWLLCFHRVEPKMVAVRQFLGRARYFEACNVFYIPKIVNLTQMRYNNLSVKLDSDNGIRVMVQHAPHDQDTQPRATLQVFDLSIVYALAIRQSLSTVMNMFFDDFARADTLSPENLDKVHREVVGKDILRITRGAVDAAIHSLRMDNIFMEDIAVNFNRVTPKIIEKLHDRLLANGILLQDVQMAGIRDAERGGYMDELERRSRAVQTSIADQQSAVATAQARIVEAEQTNLSEKARQTADMQIFEREKGVQDVRIELQKRIALAGLQETIEGLQVFTDDEHPERNQLLLTLSRMDPAKAADMLTEAFRVRLETLVNVGNGEGLEGIPKIATGAGVLATLLQDFFQKSEGASSDAEPQEE